MTIRSKVSAVVKSALNRLGYDIVSIERADGNSFTMEEGLKRCAQRGIPIETVIDIGASNGSWTQVCRQSFPDAHYLLVEAQPCHEAELIKLRDEVVKTDYVLAAAGNRKRRHLFRYIRPFRWSCLGGAF